MSRRLTIILVAAVAILAVGVVGIASYVFLIMPNAGKGSSTAAAESGKLAVEAKIYTMDHFVTNLSDTDRLRYIDVTIALGLKTAESETSIKEAEPMIRDLVLKQIRSLKSSDLAGPIGQEKLAESMELAMPDSLKAHVTKIYVTDMVIQ